MTLARPGATLRRVDRPTPTTKDDGHVDEVEFRALYARLRGDAGMNTAEYAVGTLAAVAFAGLLLKVITSDTVRAALSGLIERSRS